MSVTDAFRLLNSSLRGIRNDERQHEQNMQKLETDKARLEYEMNDPQRLEARQKAADRIKITEGQSGIVLNPDNVNMDQTYAFNQSLPGLNKMLANDGVELTNKGVMVDIGTTKRSQHPKWKADELRAQIGIYMSMESGKESMNAGEIKSLNSRLTILDQDVSEAGEASPKQKMDRGRMRERLSVLQAKRDDPVSYSKMLMTDNIAHMDALNKLYRMPTENAELIDMLHKKLKINNTMLDSMSSATGVKGLKSFSYTRPGEAGSIRTRVAYHKPGTAPAAFTDEKGQKWTMGTHKAAPGAGTASNRELLTKAKQNSEIDKYTDLKNQRAVIGNKERIQKYIMDLVSSGKKNREDANQIGEMLRTANDEVIINLDKQISGIEKQYSGEKWFDRVAGKKSKSPKVSGKTEDKDFSNLW